jgi:hypothetical protein
VEEVVPVYDVAAAVAAVASYWIHCGYTNDAVVGVGVGLQEEVEE